MISGYAQNGHGEEALRLFRIMKKTLSYCHGQRVSSVCALKGSELMIWEECDDHGKICYHVNIFQCSRLITTNNFGFQTTQPCYNNKNVTRKKNMPKTVLYFRPLFHLWCGMPTFEKNECNINNSYLHNSTISSYAKLGITDNSVEASRSYVNLLYKCINKKSKEALAKMYINSFPHH